jgi:hypothetical protein
MFMSEFRMEAVGDGQDKSVTMPEAYIVFEILERIWMICSEEKFGGYWKPEGEFLFRERHSYDRIFRVRTFEGREEANRESRESDRGPGHNGLDVLGKYSLGDSTIIIYVDACRRAVSEYGDGVWKLENLIKVVLIHELAHLITHQGFKLTGREANHVWEYTAQCATYAYLKTHGEAEDLKAFEDLSPHQPFIYQTWESLRAIESVYAEKRVAELVKSVFSLLRKPDQRGTLGDNENYDS